MKLSEKGSERGLEGGFGRYEEAEMGRKEPSQRSLGPRRGRFRGFSDSFLTAFYEVRPRRSPERFLHCFAWRSSALRSRYAPLVGSRSRLRSGSKSSKAMARG